MADGHYIHTWNTTIKPFAIVLSGARIELGGDGGDNLNNVQWKAI
jgi:hypothetical protein